MSFCIGLNKKITYLPQILDLTNYEVATTDCYLPVHILSAGNIFTVMVSSDAGMSYDKLIEVKVSANKQGTTEILDEISQQLIGYLELMLTQTGELVVKSSSANVKVRLPHSLAVLFGLSNPIVSNTSQQGGNGVAFDILFQRVLVTSNIVEPFQFNNKYMPCLYAGSPTNTIGHPLYVKTMPGKYYSLSLGFHNLFGDALTIHDESFSIVLHFKKS